MSEILDTVRRGRFHDLPRLLAPLTPAERKELLVPLKELRTELRGWGWREWEKRGKIAAALLVAGADCHTGAAATASWIGARDLRVRRGPGDPAMVPLLVEILTRRDAAWVADVAHRLAARTSTSEEDHPLIRELVRSSGCAVPMTDGYVRGWAVHLSREQRLRQWLPQEPEVAALVVRLCELPELPPAMFWSPDPDHPKSWQQSLVRLTECGAVERPALVDACVARLLRGGGTKTSQDLRFFRELLERFALTPEERGARIPDWMGMASDGTALVAAYAQTVLAELAESGALPDRTLAEMSAAVCFRTEKKLVRAQLTLLGKILRARAKQRDTEAVGVLLRPLGDVFGHADTGARERALKLVARHLPEVDAVLREELVEAAALLGPALREQAAEVFGEPLPGDVAVAAGAETLPPPPARRRVAAPPDSLGELVAELVATLDDDTDPLGFERVLDGMVRMAYRDRQPLAQALVETYGEQWWFRRTDDVERYATGANSRELVVSTLAGTVPLNVVRKVHTFAPGSEVCPASGLNALTSTWLAEVAWRLAVDPQPSLLAVPTWETGALDAGVLVERLREFQRLGSRPGPADFARALLRVAPGGDADAAKEAAALGTAEGVRLAAWLTDGPALTALANPGGEREDTAVERPSGGLLARTTRGALALVGRAKESAAEQELPARLRWLARPVTPGRHRHTSRCTGRYENWVRQLAQWTVVLPHHREAVATWLVRMTEQLSDDYLTKAEWRLVARSLPKLAEGEGEGLAGPATHLALAVGMGAEDREARLAAVDALLVLAARGQADAGLLGRQLGERLQRGELKANRLAEAAGTAADSGAHATTWGLLAALLPSLFVRTSPALGQVLSVAADCAERCAPDDLTGAEPLVPGLEALTRGSRAAERAIQARRLLATLRRVRRGPA
ncbi:DUF6493 family protein [Streptomyces sp. NPDC057638]|uniref:DUF6493 family protein n=1 Tax=Streptomyces sp. NPDC057638 TaxID=3346190 RepID=UPI0036C23AEB